MDTGADEGERAGEDTGAGAAQEQFGEILRRLRVDAGLTQEELSEIARISVRTVSNLERGTRAPRITTTRLLAAALGVDEATAVRLRRLARLKQGG